MNDIIHDCIVRRLEHKFDIDEYRDDDAIYATDANGKQFKVEFAVSEMPGIDEPR